jgi:tetratricopeptide (TPR) repeat protein
MSSLDTSNYQTKASLLLAQQHHMAGKLFQAETLYKEILQSEPNNPDALNLLGVINHQAGNLDLAVDLISKALKAYPEFPEALNNLGNAYIDLDLFQEAIDSYNLALSIKPKYEVGKNNLCEAFYKLGNYFHKLSKYEEATVNYVKALTIKPRHAKASFNLGVTFSAQGKLEEAAKSYIVSLASDPNQAEPHSNLGNVLVKLKRYNDAVESYLKALSIKPDYAEAHFNLGVAYRDLGMLTEAKASYHDALAIEPGYVEVWNNLKYVTKALQSQGEDDLTKLSRYARATNDFAFQQFYLDGFRPHQADESLKKAITTLPAKSDQTITINTPENPQSSTAQLTEKVVALLHFGRSGTGLLHSLVDNHPEVSTLPSIYLSGYFNKGVWDRLSTDGWRGLPQNFINEFAVLFDARNPKPIPSKFGEGQSMIGEKEGMTALGKNRNEYLSVDGEGFCNAATNIMEGMEDINPMSFLLVAHAAFEEVTRQNEEQVTNKHLCFYHIHNPDHYALANFLRYAKDARILMIVREPMENCQSWIRGVIDEKNYEQCVFRILTLLFDIDQVFFRTTESVGFRLEDLKHRHKDTLKALCNWLGVKVCPTLYEMTAQGKKWWGDTTSPNYSKDNAMSAFSDATTHETASSILSDSDQFILRTLFYPFSVHFGYLKSNKEKFESDLNEIKPLIGGMMDFEKAMQEQLNLSPDQFSKMEAYKIFHTGLLDRWQVLDEFGDYPHMLRPLVIG